MFTSGSGFAMMCTGFLIMNSRRSFFFARSGFPSRMPAKLRATILLAAVVIGLPCVVRAQTLSLDTTFQAPLFTANAQAARLVTLPSGQFLLFSGDLDPFVGFDRISGTTTGNLVRFNADGSLDASFSVDPALHAKSITAVAPMANGQYVVGTFFVSDTNNHGQVYRLNADGSVDTTFDPGPETANASVFRAVAVQSDGKVLAGASGEIDYKGVNYTGLLRLNADGSIDTGFNVTLGNDGTVDFPGIAENGAIQLQSDGKIIIAAGFSSVNGTTQNTVARLNNDGSLDTSFVPSGFSGLSNNSSGNNQILPTRAAAIQTDGKIVVAGRFNELSNSFVDQVVVRLNTDGSNDNTFNAPFHPSSEGFAVLLQPDGKILVSDEILGLLRLNTDGSADTAFNPTLTSDDGAAGVVYSIGVLPGGQILVAGGVSSTGVLRLNADGTTDTTFNVGTPQADAPPYHVAIRGNGTILAAGQFDTVAGQPRDGLAILNANGSLNAATLPSVFLSGYDGGADFILQPDDNKILLFGSTPPFEDPGFTYLRLNADLSVDTTLTAEPSVTAFGAVLYQPGNGYLLSAGGVGASLVVNATTYALDPANLLHRLNLQGAPDPDFVPAIDVTTIFDNYSPGNLENATFYAGDDTALAVQPDGKILYQYYDKTEAYRLVRFNADGSADSGFQIGSAPPTSPPSTGFSDVVNTGFGDEQAMEVGAASSGIGGAFVQSNGRIVIYGDFATYNGQTANGLARLNANGTLDTTFNTGTGPQGPGGAVGSAYAVTNTQELPNGQLLLVGSFQAFNGVALPGIARLNANGSVDTTFTASGIVSQQVSIGPNGQGAGSSRLTPEPGNGTYLLTGNYTTTNGAGAGTFFRLFSGVSTTPVPVTPVVPSNLPAFFNGAVPLSGGFYYLAFANGNPFGYYNLDFYPYLYHSDLGFEYVIDAQDGKNGVYLYDFASKTFFYTSPGYPFPYLYDFTLKTVLYYFPDTNKPGHYTANPRYFYNFATKKVITK